MIIDGKQLSLAVKDELKVNIQNFKYKYNKDIVLAVVLVGENPASQIYVKNKIKACEYVGIKSLSFNLPLGSTEDDVIELVSSLAKDDKIDGILVQLPLPNGINTDKVLSFIPASKDVDGFLATNLGNLAKNSPTVISCTPFGVMKMLQSTGVDLKGKNAVVLGRSNIVGKPMAMLLLNADCTVTVCHSKTENLKNILKNADIVIAAIGKPKFVTEDMIKQGAIVIDVGINRIDGKICGDVDFENVEKKCSFISPVPGGVGPMTIAMLMQNTYLCALRREENV